MTEATAAAATTTTTAATTTAAATTTQAQAFDWKGALGNDHSTYEPLIQDKGWKSPAEALAGYANLEKMIGGDKIVLPGKDAKPEDWEPIFTKLGRPEKPEGYELKKPEGFDGYSDELATEFRTEAHKYGLSAKQAAALHDWWAGKTQALIKGSGEAQAAEAAKATEALNAEIAKTWGSDKATKLDAAKRAARHFGFDDEFLHALESKAGSFKMLDGLARLGAGLKEDTAAGSNGSSSILSPEAARAELLRLEADKEFRAAFTDRSHAGHAEAVKRMTALAERAAPGNVAAGYR